MADGLMADGGCGFGGERQPLAGTRPDAAGGLAPAEQSVLAALHATDGPLCPADLIRELECAGFRNPEIRSAIWHLLDRHRIRLTRDLRLVLPVSVTVAPAPNAAS